MDKTQKNNILTHAIKHIMFIQHTNILTTPTEMSECLHSTG